MTFDEGDELFDFEGEKIKLVEPDQDFSVKVNCDEDQLIDEAAGKSTEKNRDGDNEQRSHHTSLMLQLSPLLYEDLNLLLTSLV